MICYSDLKLFLLDMDGTIYLGNELIPGAKEFLKKLETTGRSFIFLTNNSSKDKLNYKEKLQRLGIDVELDQIVTSGEVTAKHLKKNFSGGRVFLLGTPPLERVFADEGFELVRDSSGADVVVLGFDQTLTYKKLWIACDYVREGVPYFATHPDFNCPLEGGKMMPDAGAMIAFIEASTGRRPIVIGKPEKYMVDMIEEMSGFSKSEMLMIGDRLYTDILLGEKANIKSLLVLSGETTREQALEKKVHHFVKSIANIIPEL